MAVKRYISLEEANNLPTKRLLAYYKKLRTTHFQEYEYDIETPEVIFYLEYITSIKGILDTREHINRR